MLEVLRACHSLAQVITAVSAAEREKRWHQKSNSEAVDMM